MGLVKSLKLLDGENNDDNQNLFMFRGITSCTYMYFELNKTLKKMKNHVV